MAVDAATLSFLLLGELASDAADWRAWRQAHQVLLRIRPRGKQGPRPWARCPLADALHYRPRLDRCLCQLTQLQVQTHVLLLLTSGYHAPLQLSESSDDQVEVPLSCAACCPHACLLSDGCACWACRSDSVSWAHTCGHHVLPRVLARAVGMDCSERSFQHQHDDCWTLLCFWTGCAAPLKNPSSDCGCGYGSGLHGVLCASWPLAVLLGSSETSGESLEQALCAQRCGG